MNQNQTAQIENELETSNKDALQSFPRIELPFPPTITPEEIINIKDGKIPSKPPNSFIIYRRAFQKQIKESGVLLKLNVVSALASEQWKKEPIEVKKAYKQLALQVNYALVEMRAREVRAKKYALELENLSNQKAHESINDMEFRGQQFFSPQSQENQYFMSSPLSQCSIEDFSFIGQEENSTFLIKENESNIFNNMSHDHFHNKNQHCINEETQEFQTTPYELPYELPLDFNSYLPGFEAFPNYAQVETSTLNYSKNTEILDFSNNQSSMNMNTIFESNESNQYYFDENDFMYLDDYPILEYFSYDDNLTNLMNTIS